MGFKMKGFSAFTKNGDNDKTKTASTIAGQEIKEDGKGNYKIGTDYEVSGVGKVITDPKGILKKHTKDGFIEDLDFTYTTKGDTTSVTGIKSPLNKNGDTRKINKAKKLTEKHVEHTTVDSPTYGTKKSNRKFPRSEKKMNKAVDLLRNQGYSEEEIEQFTGATGYKDAMDWATEPMVTKKDKSPLKKRTYSEALANDPKLNEYIRDRKNYKAGSTEYEDLQAKINAAYGTTRSEKMKESQIRRHKDDPSRKGDQNNDQNNKKNNTKTNEYIPQTVSPRKEYDPASRNKYEYTPQTRR